MSSSNSVRCKLCGYKVSLRKDGTFVRHYVNKYDNTVCELTGKSPVTVPSRTKSEWKTLQPLGPFWFDSAGEAGDFAREYTTLGKRAFGKIDPTKRLLVVKATPITWRIYIQKRVN